MIDKLAPSRGVILGVLFSLPLWLCFCLLISGAVGAQGLWLTGYGDMTELETYPAQQSVPFEAQLELQIWQSVPWYKGWLADSYWLYALWTPSDIWNRTPRLIMFYGQYHSADVFVLVGDESSHTPTGWHPHIMMIINQDTFKTFRAMIEVRD